MKAPPREYLQFIRHHQSKKIKTDAIRKAFHSNKNREREPIPKYKNYLKGGKAQPGAPAEEVIWHGLTSQLKFMGKNPVTFINRYWFNINFKYYLYNKVYIEYTWN